MVRFFDQRITTALILSGVVHLGLLAGLPRLTSVRISASEPLIPIDLIDLPRLEEKKETVALPKPPPLRRIEAKPPQPIPQQVPLRREVPKAEDLEPDKNEPEKVATPSSSPGGGGDAQAIVRGAPGTGSGAGNLFSSGDVTVVPRGGLGKGGAGRGEGPPGPGTGERGFRPAKPTQTAKVSYPPMALRMGLEADVTLKVFVDAEGKVTKVEIVKSAGMGFDEEALRTVRQFRFEPALRDGEKISSEFTYIYRFRLEK